MTQKPHSLLYDPYYGKFLNSNPVEMHSQFAGSCEGHWTSGEDAARRGGGVIHLSSFKSRHEVRFVAASKANNLL